MGNFQNTKHMAIDLILINTNWMWYNLTGWNSIYGFDPTAYDHPVMFQVIIGDD